MASSEAYPFDLQAAEATEAEQAERALMQTQIEKDDLLEVMSNPKGRRFIWWVLGEARVFHSNYSTVAMEMARREGRREIGLRLMERLMSWCPDRYWQMTKECGSERRVPRSTRKYQNGSVE